ncbi:SMP-30/gluconolactonase/LRE family protein [Kaistia dalseonensis]|uniref:Sugar lactone lactonase YvrE n=1 Tax=Kaistia dalseonensis TaxID=410840 RepID=A0ABU0H2W9_9HYPH|nr:SMP-30/gluconolactonase/LRE family protein [Kaistia dalseonensis]MCX5494079.1 SMP-30/gluconolactonase/LRE family protein [Kaistia dalseonensis]MDQ0436657.1 sugar lactone lactonase YvrE [Kaistia dalseonensis]
MIDIECVVDAKAILGEGTFWDTRENVLWWIDIWAPTIHRFDPRTGEDRVYEAPEYLGCLATREKGGLVVTMASGFYFFDPETGLFDPIVDPEADIPNTRFNDGKTDRQGRFWSGSMFEAEGPVQKVASLYRMDADLSVHKMVEGAGCSNGLAWSPDSRTMYYTDSHTTIVWAFDFDPVTGTVENRRTFTDVADTGGIVDGSTVDAEGCYWATVPVTSKICRYDPDGKLMQTILLPTDLPTCVGFGGENLDVLYCTSAVLRRPPEKINGAALAGGLFAIHTGVKGLPEAAFKG